jgi:DnaJ-class molecular chaperone
LILYHTSGVKKKKNCNLCDGTGIIARITEIPFIYSLWCTCPIGQEKVHRVFELIAEKKTA